MKKITIGLFIIMLSATAVWANSVTYTISATIPEIPGFNVPLAPDQVIDQNNAFSLQVSHEQAVRNNEYVILETIVAR